MKCPDCHKENIPGEELCTGCAHPIQAPNPRAPEGDLARRVRQGTVADLNPRPAVSVLPDASAADAARMMREEKVGCVLVATAGGVVGILTERDLLRDVAGLEDPSAIKVSEIMHARPEMLRADEPVTHAFHQMAVGGYRHMPVVTDDGAVGMISSRDLLRYLSALK